ncbi:hypothetical protein DQR70_05880 [Salmonella enterica subsp. enterica serovar Oslo]|nr:hypothetical protein [Salmonella enterica subsp. enterica serovar Oslo]
MNGIEATYIIPASGLRGLSPEEFFKGKFDFLDSGFVIETAVQMYLDYLIDGEDDSWQSAAEDAVFREYIGTIKSIAKRIVFRDKSPRTEIERSNGLLAASDLVDKFISDITNHISSVSTYISNLPTASDLEELVQTTEGELIVQNAYLRGKNIRFRIVEV